MTNPELERERGEQKYDIRRATELLYDELGQYLEEVIGDDGFLILLSALTKAHQSGESSSQQSTLRQVRAILGNSIIIDADKPLVRDVLAAIEREFGGVE